MIWYLQAMRAIKVGLANWTVWWNIIEIWFEMRALWAIKVGLAMIFEIFVQCVGETGYKCVSGHSRVTGHCTLKTIYLIIWSQSGHRDQELKQAKEIGYELTWSFNDLIWLGQKYLKCWIFAIIDDLYSQLIGWYIWEFLICIETD